ncbi:unnamed protein product [Linum tenue]|uniref:Uncharacterized protein n=1 Tax=Linum tenue TaxID=586396 RepID=A0AAV0NP02_9ROSI|nr:unnamed protein product [Linum tenue]
MRLVLQSQLPL